eukprot:GFUD01008128.1.p1 GENE.GFUD01008128.1~~GFUD01008128.1.p1  ORF type:complete len:209 (-),score=58.78 GFUD01008128.1:88-651(-)
MLSYTTTTLCLVLISAVSSISVSPRATCEECQMAYGKLVTRLLSEDSLAEQMTILKSAGCTVTADPEACITLVDTWWGVMASILYPSLMVPKDLCMGNGACEARIVREWTCDECLGGVEYAAGFFEMEESIQAAVELLSGDIFCGAPEATENCAEEMAAWMPVAIPILSAALRDQQVEICQEEVGTC